jgi:chorismate mutase
MSTATKKPKKAVARKKISPEALGSKAAAKLKKIDKKVAANREFAKNQPTLPEMEDVDERVDELDEVCQKVLADMAKRSSLADEIADDKEKIEGLLGEHNLDCYIVSGRKFYISPAESRVKIEKVKQG